MNTVKLASTTPLIMSASVAAVRPAIASISKDICAQQPPGYQPEAVSNPIALIEK